MNRQLNQVKEFHKTFKAPILDTPQIPSDQRCELRVSLLQEELNEFSKAIKDKDIVEIADSLSDIAYVLFGGCLEFGLGNKFVELFEEVQRSNMSKACNSIQEAIDTMLHYKQKDGTESTYREVNSKWIVYRSSDDKVLKNVKYSPASLKVILDKKDEVVDINDPLHWKTNFPITR